MQRYQKVVALLSVSLQYWDKASYSSPHAGTRTAFTNRMKDPAKTVTNAKDDGVSFSTAEYEGLIADHKSKLSFALENVVTEEEPNKEQTPVVEAASEAFVGGA